MQSTSHTEDTNEQRKFTRGEKCIFVHLVVTFSIILSLVIVYFIHLLVIPHSHRDVFKASRRSEDDKSKGVDLEMVPVGLVYIGSKPAVVMCNSVLLREKWSIAPAHCTAARADPQLSAILHLWRIKYKSRGKFLDSEIKRTIPHPHFDRSTFSNNIGLIEHNILSKNLSFYKFPSPALQLNDDTIKKYSEQMLLVGWLRDSTDTYDALGELSLHYSYVQPVSSARCAKFMSPIVELRPYEYCVILDEKTNGSFPDHGAVLIVDTNKVLGMFSWGEKSGLGAPSIILDYTDFKNWADNIVAW